MDIAPLSMVMSQPKVQQRADIVVMKTAMDTGKENDKQMIEKIHNDAIDTNIGQNLDVIADKQNG